MALRNYLEQGDFIPESGRLADVFQRVFADHFLVPTGRDDLQLFVRESQENLSKAGDLAASLMTTALGMLATGVPHHPTEQIGKLAWAAVDREIVQQAFSPSVIETLLLLAELKHPISRDMLQSAVASPDELMLITEPDENLTHPVLGLVIIPPQFIVRCHTDAVGGLARIASVASYAADIVSNRIARDSSLLISQRARSFEAEIALRALQENPQCQLDRGLLASLEKFPQGVASLPPGALYYSGNSRLH